MVTTNYIKQAYVSFSVRVFARNLPSEIKRKYSAPPHILNQQLQKAQVATHRLTTRLGQLYGGNYRRGTADNNDAAVCGLALIKTTPPSHLAQVMRFWRMRYFECIGVHNQIHKFTWHRNFFFIIHKY